MSAARSSKLWENYGISQPWMMHRSCVRASREHLGLCIAPGGFQESLLIGAGTFDARLAAKSERVGSRHEDDPFFASRTKPSSGLLAAAPALQIFGASTNLHLSYLPRRLSNLIAVVDSRARQSQSC